MIKIKTGEKNKTDNEALESKKWKQFFLNRTSKS